MAPEIKSHIAYNGKQVDVFSSGVVLFALVQGYFPFAEAALDSKYYSLLTERPNRYWKEIQADELSPEFKHLFESMCSHNCNRRPTVADIRAHPWLKCQSNRA